MSAAPGRPKQANAPAGGRTRYAAAEGLDPQSAAPGRPKQANAPAGGRSRYAAAEGRTTSLHERLQFDTAEGQVLDGPRRYLLLRTDVLAGLFAELAPSARAAALDAFGRSVAAHGVDSLRAYAAEPGVDGEALQRVVEAAAASLGWGRWRIARSGATLELVVRNSPFASDARRGAGPACAAIAGMLQGLAGIVLGGPAHALETSCACVAGGDVCRFAAHLDPSSSAEKL